MFKLTEFLNLATASTYTASKKRCKDKSTITEYRKSSCKLFNKAHSDEGWKPHHVSVNKFKDHVRKTRSKPWKDFPSKIESFFEIFDYGRFIPKAELLTHRVIYTYLTVIVNA